MLILPVAACLALIVLAGLHKLAGEPFGPAWARELWEWARAAGPMAAVGAGFSAWAARENKTRARPLSKPPPKELSHVKRE